MWEGGRQETVPHWSQQTSETGEVRPESAAGSLPRESYCSVLSVIELCLALQSLENDSLKKTSH